MAKDKLLDKSGLIRHSKKVYEYITAKIKGVTDDIKDVDQKVEAGFLETSKKIQDNTEKINVNKDGIDTLDTKYTELKEQLNNTVLTCDGHPDGNTIFVNNIEQYVFENVAAGETIEIPNKSGETDFMIECYTEHGAPSEIVHKAVSLNNKTTDLFVYDERYIEVTDTGVKPKSEIILKYDKTSEVVDGVEYTIYISEKIPEEILHNLNMMSDIGEV